MTKNKVLTVLKLRIANATENNQGYKIPDSYNSIWRKKADELVAKKVVRKDKKGYWLIKK